MRCTYADVPIAAHVLCDFRQLAADKNLENSALLTFLWVPPRPVRAHLPLQGCKIARSARQASCCRFSTPRTVGSQAPQPRRPRRRSRPAPSVASLDRGRGRRGEGAGPQLQSPRPRERNPLRVTHTNVRRAENSWASARNRDIQPCTDLPSTRRSCRVHLPFVPDRRVGSGRQPTEPRAVAVTPQPRHTPSRTDRPGTRERGSAQPARAHAAHRAGSRPTRTSGNPPFVARAKARARARAPRSPCPHLRRPTKSPLRLDPPPATATMATP